MGCGERGNIYPSGAGLFGATATHGWASNHLHWVVKQAADQKRSKISDGLHLSCLLVSDLLLFPSCAIRRDDGVLMPKK